MIGLKRGTVKLLPHNPKWAKIFEEEKKIFINKFGDSVVDIQKNLLGCLMSLVIGIDLILGVLISSYFL